MAVCGEGVSEGFFFFIFFLGKEEEEEEEVDPWMGGRKNNRSRRYLAIFGGKERYIRNVLIWVGYVRR